MTFNPGSITEHGISVPRDPAAEAGGAEVGPTILVMRLSERREERRDRVIQMDIQDNNLKGDDWKWMYT